MESEEVPELTNGEFEKFFKKEGLLFIDFFGEWCMPCVMMGPVIEDLAEEFKEEVSFAKVNIDDSPEIAQKFDVSVVPTFIILREGKVLEIISGSRTQEELGDLIKKHL